MTRAGGGRRHTRLRRTVTGGRSATLPIGMPIRSTRTEQPWSPTGVELFGGEVYVLEYDDETPTEDRNWPLRLRKVDSDGKASLLTQVRVTEKK